MKRNLVLVNELERQAIGELEAVRDHIVQLNPDIDVHIAFNSLRNSRLDRRIRSNPTMVVSFTRIKFTVTRGRVFSGRSLSKIDELGYLAKCVPVPKTKLFAPGLQLDPADWGDVVLLKPNRSKSSRGRGVGLVRHARLDARAAALIDEHGPKGTIVQKFVHTGRNPASYRVLTLFGEPLYCTRSRRLDVDVDLSADDALLESAWVSTTGPGEKERAFLADPDVLALARQVHAALPDVPLKGIDIVREEASGTLYVLECNPGGNVWLFSAAGSGYVRAGYGRSLGSSEEHAEAVGREAMLSQFGALKISARVLAEMTRLHAA